MKLTNLSKKKSIFGASVAATLMLGASVHAAVIAPVGGDQSTAFIPAFPAVTNTADVNGSDQNIAFTQGDNWNTVGGSPIDQQWFYLDLGAEYDLGVIELWQYNAEIPEFPAELNGRGVNAYELFVGATGATVPVGLSGTPFDTLNGWTSANSGNIAIGQSTKTALGSIAPQDVDVIFDASAFTGVRYVGFKVVSNHLDPFQSVGLGQIRVSSIPEPSTTALLGFAGFALILRRRK